MCWNWIWNYRWNIPRMAVNGVRCAQLARIGNKNKQVFVVNVCMFLAKNGSRIEFNSSDLNSRLEQDMCVRSLSLANDSIHCTVIVQRFKMLFYSSASLFMRSFFCPCFARYSFVSAITNSTTCLHFSRMCVSKLCEITPRIDSMPWINAKRKLFRWRRRTHSISFEIASASRNYRSNSFKAATSTTSADEK